MSLSILFDAFAKFFLGGFIFQFFNFRPLAMRTAAEHTPTSDAIITDDSWLLYSQRNVHIMNTKTGQYRRMRQEWRNSVVLGRSRIQGLGLFTKKDIEEVYYSFFIRFWFVFILNI